jgi:penicillin-binding protein A
MVTATGALEAGITNPSKTYPVQTSAVLEGVELENANGEYCGGTLVMSFAKSCNSVFAPLGVQLGAKRLVSVAERYGFNREPDIAGAAMSTIPPAGEIGDDLALGSSAIGQGRVQATALQMATIAAAIGLRGRLPHLTLDYDEARDRAQTQRATSERVARTMERMMLAVVRGGTGVNAAIGLRGRLPHLTLDYDEARDRAQTQRATSERVARTMERMMLAVVRGGTGVNAAIPGVAVAGKTGTAELKTTKRCDPDPANPESCPAEDQKNDPTDTDAWFAAYAPAGRGRPHVAVGVLLVASGAGGDTAAPAAKQILQAGLKATR